MVSAIQIQNQAQHAMRGRVLRTHIERHATRARVRFGGLFGRFGFHYRHAWNVARAHS